MAFKTAGVAGAALAVMAVGLLWAKGIPSRFPVAAVTVASYLDHGGTNYYRDGSCFLSSGNAFQDFNYAACLREDSSKRNYLLLGDSHAAHLWYGLSTTLDAVNVMQATASGCRPTVEQAADAEDRCRLLMNYIFSSFLPSHHVDAVLLSGRWKEEDIPRLSTTIVWANERKIPIILFGPMLQYDSPLPRLLATSIKNNAPALPFDHRIAEYQRVDGVLMKLARQEWKVQYISFFETLCGTSSCIEYAGDDVPLQFDASHLTKDGSVLVARRLEDNRELP